MKKTKTEIIYAILCIIFFIPQTINAQKLDWVSTGYTTFSPLEVLGSCLDGNGNAYIVGMYTDSAHLGDTIISNSNAGNTGFIISLNAKGKNRWAINPTGNCALVSIASDGYNGVIVTGYASNKTTIKGNVIDSGRSFILRIDTIGNVKWINNYNNYNLYAVEAKGGNIYIREKLYGKDSSVNIGGKIIKGGLESNNNFIFCLDKSGNVKWGKLIFSCDNFNIQNSNSPICSDNNGDIYQVLNFELGNPNSNIHGDSVYINNTKYFIENRNSPSISIFGFLFKINSSGEFAWVNPENFGSYNMLSADGMGNTYSPSFKISHVSIGDTILKVDSANYSFFLVKVDSSGSPQWAVPYSGMPEQISSDNSGHTYLALNLGTKNTNYISEYNYTGATTWTDTIVSGGFSNISTISPDNSGKLFFSGSFDSMSAFQLDPAIRTTYSLNIYMGVIDNKDNVSEGVERTQFPNTTFSLYPNPTTQNITLKYTSSIPAAYACTITDITGREVQNTQIQAMTGQNISQVNIQNLSAGMYIISLQNGNTVQRVKFIKN